MKLPRALHIIAIVSLLAFALSFFRNGWDKQAVPALVLWIGLALLLFLWPRQTSFWVGCFTLLVVSFQFWIRLEASKRPVMLRAIDGDRNFWLNFWLSVVPLIIGGFCAITLRVSSRGLKDGERVTAKGSGTKIAISDFTANNR